MSRDIYNTEERAAKLPIPYTVNFHYDEPRHDYMGHFSDQWQPGAIDRQEAGTAGRREYRYWIPTPGGESWEAYQRSTRAWYTNHGYNKHQAGTAAHQHRAQDWRRIEGLLRDDWHYMGIEVVTAWGNESLWGIESDSGEEYIEEVIADLLHGLLNSVSFLNPANIQILKLQEVQP